jgi:FixJ family two-component response regulator
MTTRPLISVVDDDESVRESLPDLLKELGFAVEVFSSGEEFLASPHLLRTSCLILDIAMPGMSGTDVQRELKVRQQPIPIIFITAHGDASVRPHLIQQGAVDVLFKPFTESALLAAIETALRAR